MISPWDKNAHLELICTYGAWGVQIVKFLQFQVENWKKHYNFKVKIAKTTAILR